MYGVYRDPEGENVFEQPGPSNDGGGIMISSSVSIDPFLNDQENIQALLRRIAELENKINKETKTHKVLEQQFCICDNVLYRNFMYIYMYL